MLLLQDIEEKAAALDKSLRADDPRFRNSVLIVCDEGSIFLWENAFILEDNEWVAVFTEHHRFHVFSKSDLISFKALKSLKISKW